MSPSTLAWTSHLHPAAIEEIEELYRVHVTDVSVLSVACRARACAWLQRMSWFLLPYLCGMHSGAYRVPRGFLRPSLGLLGRSVLRAWTLAPSRALKQAGGKSVQCRQQGSWAPVSDCMRAHGNASLSSRASVRLHIAQYTFFKILLNMPAPSY
eukprot:scaffold112955_cov32-Tisochrysis_lutea.AAC.1